MVCLENIAQTLLFALVVIVYSVKAIENFAHPEDTVRVYSSMCTQRWEFIKENRKTRTRPRKRSRKQEKKKENMLSTKKATKKKENTITINERTFFLDRFLRRERVFFHFSYFPVFFYKFPPLSVCSINHTQFSFSDSTRRHCFVFIKVRE